MKGYRSFLFLIIFLVILYMLGPRVQAPDLDPVLPDLGLTVEEVDRFVQQSEAGVMGLKPDNHARITWARDPGVATAYSIVYLHGFSASPAEGSPVQEALAERYGANLYRARLYGHGIDEMDPLLEASGEDWIASAKEALAIGHLLGDSLIVMSCSTGGTLSLYLAAHHPDLHALLLYSPNIEFAKPGSSMLTGPWGLQLARLFMGSKYRTIDASADMCKFWTCSYRLEGLIRLKKLVESTMNGKTFQKIRQPLFLAYYYKNEQEQDEIVKVSEMLNMFEEVSTPANLKRKQSFPDADAHVILSDITSKDVDGVMKATFDFCDEILKMRPVRQGDGAYTKRSR